MDSYKENNVDCSIVVPLYNESSVVGELYQRLTKTMADTGLDYELVFVDDGSSDDTLLKIKSFAAKDNKVIVIELTRNFGQTPALAAGFDNARGKIVISMDGDLQHAPEEIPEFIEKINQGYDVVSGWRKQRVDNLLLRKVPSRLANHLASKISGVEIHDFGTTFKAYTQEVIKDLNLYSEMHRFIPALLAGKGVRIIEIPISNIVRPKGSSNYGISRTFGVILDLITLRFVLGYITKPLHYFGRAAMVCFLATILLSCYILYDKFAYKVPIFAEHGPMALLAVVFFLVGFILISTGLIGEIIVRVYFESTGKKIFSIRKIYRKELLATT